MQTNTICSNWL